ncbi:MAG: translation initiation factor [Flavobacteriales bacterium]|nr:translation initiation factor [Flavobacteriales bacterium]
MNKNKIKQDGIVYSTSSTFNPKNEEGEIERETLLPEKQNLRVFIEKNHRGGKIVTLVKGFIGKENDLELLGKELKVKCGTGGSVKNGEILIQGDVRNKTLEYLIKKGYKAK